MSNSVNKPKKSAQEIIDMMRDEKGIKFTIMNEESAKEYLLYKNNYLRTASYRRNYEKYLNGESMGKYIDLEFASLTVASSVDMHLRAILLKMCIDVEHALKVYLLRCIENNENEDGYNIVNKYFENNPKMLRDIEQKAGSIFTGDLIEKYFVFDNSIENRIRKIIKVDCPIWVFVEIIGFHSLLKFYQFYCETYEVKQEFDISLMNSIKSLRNACAHNNCLLNSLKEDKSIPNYKISQFITSIKEIGKEQRNKKLKKRPLYEITCLIYLYDKIATDNMKSKRYSELKKLKDEQIKNNWNYFTGNQILETSFDFLVKVIDNLEIK